VSEAPLTAGDFPAFFEAIWGFGPFPWQADLVQRLATGHDLRRGHIGEPGIWPDVLDLPTGSGKTAALDIAVFHLAMDADRGERRRAPLRIAYVVDRRLIVDDAYERAKSLCRALRWSLLNDHEARATARANDNKNEMLAALDRVRAAPTVTAAALRLARLAQKGQPPLLARSLRGGAPREDDWARTPVQPTILCSTVDQVGSRLLFRGYGVSDEMKPVHAGLLGSDCLILLDEAHLSEPFRQTLKAVKKLRKPDDAPFGLALLTATPPDGDASFFELSAADREHPILSHRLEAPKPARLAEISRKQGVDTESRRAEEIAAQAEAMIGRLRGKIDHPAIGVVVNRVARARSVFERLRKTFGLGADSGTEESVDIRLIIGPARSVDRDRIAAGLDPIRTARREPPRRLSKPLIVVATQTIEAGVDIDFDGLVTEAAAFDALRQRFGRLNRAGRPIQAEGVVLAHKEDIGAKADDPVYGDRIAETWKKLSQISHDTAGVVNFGVDALRALIGKGPATELAAPIRNAPVLLRPYADLWSQTSPVPNADPDIALFLHGPERAPASIQIVWRADIRREDVDEAGRRRLIDLLALVPPRAAEAIEVPIWAARAFLRRQINLQAELADAPERPPDAGAEYGWPAFRYAGEKSENTRVVRARDLRDGDLIVVPADYGGCDKWGWSPGADEPVVDVADEAAWPYRARRFAVRVTPKLIAQGFGVSGAPARPSVEPELAATLADHREDRPPALLDAVLELDLPQALRNPLEALKNRRKGLLQAEFPYGVDDQERPRGVVFIAPAGLKADQSDASTEDISAMPATEDDELGSFSRQPIGLAAHCEHVRDWARLFACAAGLRPDVAEDISLAASLHDTGKADSRFQAYLAGGDPYGPDAKEALAKSGQRRLPTGAWERAGLPDRWRHEALSVRIAPRLPAFAAAHDPMLALWLIGVHHGYGRPFFPHSDAKDAEARPGLLSAFGGEGDLKQGSGPQCLAFDFEGLDWTQMFDALKARYGIWGLARLEAFVRLADHRASEAGGPPEKIDPAEGTAE